MSSHLMGSNNTEKTQTPEDKWKDRSAESIYDSEILPHLSEIELTHKECKKATLISVGSALFSLGGIFFMNVPSLVAYENVFAGIGLLGLILISFFGFKAFMSYRVLRSRYKQEVVSKVINCFGDDLCYQWKNYIPEMTYHDSNLFKSKINRYNGEDYVSGTRGKVPFEFSEIFTQKVTTTYQDGKKKKETETIFRGIFFKASFNKSINGETLIYPDFAEKTFGKLIGGFLQSKNLEHAGDLIKLEDEEFEKKFAVYGTDQIESRYILTPKMMQNMTYLQSKIKLPMHFCFKGEYVYVAITNHENLFEPRVFGELVKIEDIEKMHNIFSFLMSIIDEMSLNTRIWSKTWENEPHKTA